MPRDASPLRETQARFYGWVTSGAPIAGGDATALPAERIGVYAGMYLERIAQALAEVYPKLAAAVGDDVFRALVAEYVRVRPPAHPMLQRAGSHFPRFVASHALGAARPWLAELARLEWARFFAVDAPDSAPLRDEQLRALDAKRLAELPLRLVAAHAIVESRYAVDTLWRKIHDSAAWRPAARPRARSILVWRRDLIVLHRRLTSFETRIVRLAQAGATFGDACALAAGSRLPVAQASERVFETVGRFIAEEVLSTADPGRSAPRGPCAEARRA